MTFPGKTGARVFRRKTQMWFVSHLYTLHHVFSQIIFRFPGNGKEDFFSSFKIEIYCSAILFFERKVETAFSITAVMEVSLSTQ